MARTLAEGSDVTLVGWGAQVLVLAQAAKAAASLPRPISCEVIDLRTLMPWDADAVAASVNKTGARVVARALGPPGWPAAWGASCPRALLRLAESASCGALRRAAPTLGADGAAAPHPCASTLPATRPPDREPRGPADGPLWR